jgi:hypothetical protein
MTYKLTNKDLVWNRACSDDSQSDRRRGDLMLRAMIRLHSLVMNGGLDHALECLSTNEFAEGINGFEYFGLHEHADLLRLIHSKLAADERLDATYEACGDDSVLLNHFERFFENNPTAFAEVGPSR